MADTQDIKDKLRAGDYEGVRSAVADAAGQAKQKAEEFTRTAREKLEQSRTSAADAMDSTAEGLRKTGAGATSAAGGLNDAANYVRQNSFRDMFADLTVVIRKNPTPTLIAAVALGFILGSAMRRD